MKNGQFNFDLFSSNGEVIVTSHVYASKISGLKGDAIMSVGRICTREVDLAEADESVQAAAQRMHARNVGTLVVLDSDKRPLGMVTDRDRTVRVLGNSLDAFQTTVGKVMTAFPRTVREDTPIEDALRIMRLEKCRRLPVINDTGRLFGLLSVDDIPTHDRGRFDGLSNRPIAM